MNLPLVIDIAIGLVFIYLILSLLTSEIQELITILLQWRAEHLKKAIEDLLTGDGAETDRPLDRPLDRETDRPIDSQLSFARRFTDELYNSPLIRSLNQEARGLLATAFRCLVQAPIAAYRAVTGTTNVFGRQQSGPSYIPSETFSAALLQQLHLDRLRQKVRELTVRQFRDDILAELRDILTDLQVSVGHDPLTVGDGSLLDREFKALETQLEETIADFANSRSTLMDNLAQLTTQFSLFVDHAVELLADDHPCKDIIRRRLAYFRQKLTRKPLDPTLTELLRVIWSEAEDASTRAPSPWITATIARLNQEDPELLRTLINLPVALRQSLLSLAEQSRLQAKSWEDEIVHLEQQVEDWFNRSMDRAAGVYRRNAKGVGILIGFLVAIAINADTLHMIDRLSKDTLLRSTITDAAEQLVRRVEFESESPTPLAPSPVPEPVSPDSPLPDPIAPVAPSLEQVPEPDPPVQTELQAVKDAVDAMLDEIPLPIGWNPINTDAQTASSQGWIVPLFKRLLGWLITGIALSMGASFWYDLLGKVMRVRTTGNPPAKTTSAADTPKAGS